MNKAKRLFLSIACVIVITVCFYLGKPAVKVNANEKWDTYSNTWALTDALGRTATGEKKDEKNKKYVAIFYHIWHYNFTSTTVNADKSAPRNMTKIIQNNENALTNSKVWGPDGSYHYWGEPLFGYYNLAVDEYVIRKHAQMLSDAGVDTLIIDYSNYYAGGSHDASSYTKSSLQNLLDVFLKIRNEGGKTPYVSLLLTWNAQYSAGALEHFYKDFYSDPKYADLWFQWEGKPLVLAEPTHVSEELKGYFTFRKPHPFYTPVTEANAWPWLSIYPQKPGYTKDNDCEVVTVGVAQNWTTSLDFMSATDADGNFIARGRSYTVGGENKLLKDPASEEYNSKNGANFQQQFDKALELDPSIIFVTGWNEWIAGRINNIPSWAASSKKKAPVYGGFCDDFTTEFSRDIEPTREGNLIDNFYNQLVINIRKFKGSGAQIAAVQRKDISLDSDFSVWNDIALEFRDDIGDTSLRDFKGIGKNSYQNTTGRNDFKLTKTTYNKENIYFYVETVNDITPFSDSAWMNLFIKTSSSDNNWEGFNYVLNREGVQDGITKLEHSTGGWNWEVSDASVKYKVSGNKMVIEIPRASLGIDEGSKIDVKFKWMDNMQVPGDAMEFYLNGDCAPNERFSYAFTNVSSDKSFANGWNTGFIVASAAGALCLAAGIVILVIKKRKKSA